MIPAEAAHACKTRAANVFLLRPSLHFTLKHCKDHHIYAFVYSLKNTHLMSQEFYFRKSITEVLGVNEKQTALKFTFTVKVLQLDR